ncbi:hypothetical protein [Roseimaritima ulvae]|uniref:Uncharacterized protein n=1 Tax=Roseimaritima ulvae TaxID=980254 RepID=A0A5B9QX85_9BACT|nr:hypothetical protein [Roseimaritima ulvae]QEG41975.1 hypothetical protein UC8_40040 [Roseimaritima ulvae]
MSLDTLVQPTPQATPDTIARRVVEVYLRGCPFVDAAGIPQTAHEIVQQASDSCRSFATADAQQLCKLSLRLASQHIANSLCNGAACVIPSETPCRMSAAEPVRLAAPIRFGDWRDVLRPDRGRTLTVEQ